MKLTIEDKKYVGRLNKHYLGLKYSHYKKLKSLPIASRSWTSSSKLFEYELELCRKSKVDRYKQYRMWFTRDVIRILKKGENI